MSILELDLGNTRCKWRLLDDPGDAPVFSASGAALRGAFATTAWYQGALPDVWRKLAVTRVRVANVAGSDIARIVRETFAERFTVEAEFATVTARCNGITCAYDDVGRLGVDRWLAVLAAHHRDPSPALVVDCGSAVTLDLLGDGGSHLGGYIVPGLALMRRALFEDTDAVKVDVNFSSSMALGPGKDTVAAVNRGLPLMVLGAIDRALQQLRVEVGAAVAPKLWLTGGDGAFFSSICAQDHILVDDLVLDGLVLTNP